MNVQELKDALDDFPEEWEVVLFTPDGSGQWHDHPMENGDSATEWVLNKVRLVAQ